MLMARFFHAFKYSPPAGEGFILKENKTDTYAPQKKEPSAPLPEVSAKLSDNLNVLSRAYRMPENHDITVRRFSFFFRGESVRAFIIFIDGMTGNASINESILEPLMIRSRSIPAGGRDIDEYVGETLLTENQVSQSRSMDEVCDAVNAGSCALFLDGSVTAFICDVKTWEHRGVGAPLSENVIRGPQESFCETLRMNTALIRKIMTDRELVMEKTHVGSRSRTAVVIAYLGDVINPELLSHIKRRLSLADADFCLDSGELEQLLEPRTGLLTPRIHATERPDRVCQAIADGRAAVLVGGSPYALILPALFTDFLYSVEDRYVRAPYGMLIRAVRLMAWVISVFLSGVFIAIVSFHEELLPTKILLSVQASCRETAFPLILQLLFLELMFEILHEAAIRMPRHIGAIIGIAGALVMGNTLIGEGVVSSAAVICTAMSVLSTFTSPSYMQNIHLRLLRFLFIPAGAAGGLFLICAAAFTVAAFSVSLKSFGVPYFSPVAPFTKKSFLSALFRGSLHGDNVRTDPVNPEKKYKKEVRDG